MRRFENIVMHPKGDDYWDEVCPSGFNDCDNCKYRNYIGTFGGEFYVDCAYDESEEACEEDD